MPHSQSAQTWITQTHSFICNLGLHHACLSFVSVHQMAPPLTGVADIQLQLTTYLYRPRRDERLSWPGWLTHSGLFTHISRHPSATGRAQDREVFRPKTDVLPLCDATIQTNLPGVWLTGAAGSEVRLPTVSADHRRRRILGDTRRAGRLS